MKNGRWRGNGSNKTKMRKMRKILTKRKNLMVKNQERYLESESM